MIEAQIIIDKSKTLDVNAYLTLPFEQRQKSRQKAQLDSGEDIGIFLPRGTILRHGDILQTNNGMLVEIRAAQERVSVSTSKDSLLLSKACYHLGNRHVALQIMQDKITYLHDHVLDDMVRQLGLEVNVEQLAFEPEAGAYGGTHGHGHSH